LLIEGLEIVFSHCKKGEVFKVKISSEYAYDDRDEIKLIPPNSSLIFEINVLNMVKQKV
jgi:FKBP-type peptidyl-prolyl cis-trans isomerase